MKPCDVTKFIKFYLACDSANRPKTGRNCARLASFLLLSVFPPCLYLFFSSFSLLANSDYSSGYQHQYKSHYPYQYDSAPATESSRQSSNYLYHNLTGIKHSHLLFRLKILNNSKAETDFFGQRR